MQTRYVSIWFRYFKTDWFTRRKPALEKCPFVLYMPDHGRMIITASNKLAEVKGIFPGTVLADARAIIPSLQAIEEQPDSFDTVIKNFAEWFIRYSPVVAANPPDGLIINASGCPHLWGGEQNYLAHINERLTGFGYTVHAAMAGTAGMAWAASHYRAEMSIIENGKELEALNPLPPEALRLNNDVVERLYKLGLLQVKDFIGMPQSVLRRRFGEEFITRLNQALGNEEEFIEPVEPAKSYQERLQSLEPIVTATGIEIALKQLLEILCRQLKQEEKGLRMAILSAYRVDGKMEKISIGINRPSSDTGYLYNLFQLKIETIEPDFGIELFILEALQVEDHQPKQEKLWHNNGDIFDHKVAQLVDRISNKIGENKVNRYLPDEHYWPERSVKKAGSLDEKTLIEWNGIKPRPLKILLKPEPISVTAPVPDYPPMLFRYKGKIHKIIKADGPERIEQEWWMQEGLHRDYYYVEDEEGHRYWLFRLGHYDDEKPVGWFLHGFFS